MRCLSNADRQHCPCAATGAQEVIFQGGVVLNVIFKKIIFALISPLTLYIGNVSNLPP